MENQDQVQGVVGIKETMEILDAAHAPIQQAVKIMSDGNVTADEIAAALAEVVAKGKVAFENANLVPAELKDLDIAEVMALTMKAVQIAGDAYQLIKLLKK